MNSWTVLVPPLVVLGVVLLVAGAIVVTWVESTRE